MGDCVWRYDSEKMVREGSDTVRWGSRENRYGRVELSARTKVSG